MVRIYGIGVDICQISRLDTKINLTPRLLERLFHPSECQLSAPSLAARFAAKEAFMKAIGDYKGLYFREIEIVKDALGKPRLKLHNRTRETVANLGDFALHLSLSHDSGFAIATVVVETE